MKRVLIIGRSGQLAQALIASAPDAVHCEAWGRDQLDLLQPDNELSARLSKWRPDVVINAAAYTAVDRAEQDAEACWRMNCDAVAEIGKTCRQIDSQLLHVSTDFVFDGALSRPYRPTDPCKPLNTYGESKRAGEERLQAEHPDAIIVRTAWLYSGEGQNFLLTMLRLMREKEQLQVVSDQVGTPTRAINLAKGLWLSLQHKLAGGIWHFTDAGVASWYDFAVAIQDIAYQLKLLERRIPIQPIFSEDYPTPARRASFTVMDCRQTWRALELQPSHWRQALYDELLQIAQARI